jgi:hypothetical protein
VGEEREREMTSADDSHTHTHTRTHGTVIAIRRKMQAANTLRCHSLPSKLANATVGGNTGKGGKEFWQ